MPLGRQAATADMHTFVITLRPRAGDGWPVVAEESEVPIALPNRAGGHLAIDPTALGALDPEDYGESLGQALFAGELLALFRAARARSGDRLHVTLCVEDKELLPLRWERLCAPDGDRWHPLLRDQRTPFSLNLPTGHARQYKPVGLDDLRALVLVACPTGLERYHCAPFDVARVVASVREALGPVPCDVLAETPGAVGPPTLDALCERVTEAGYPLLHVACHGRSFEESVLYLHRPASPTACHARTTG